MEMLKDRARSCPEHGDFLCPGLPEVCTGRRFRPALAQRVPGQGRILQRQLLFCAAFLLAGLAPTATPIRRLLGDCPPWPFNSPYNPAHARSGTQVPGWALPSVWHPAWPPASRAGSELHECSVHTRALQGPEGQPSEATWGTAGWEERSDRMAGRRGHPVCCVPSPVWDPETTESYPTELHIPGEPGTQCSPAGGRAPEGRSPGSHPSPAGAQQAREWMSHRLGSEL